MSAQARAVEVGQLPPPHVREALALHEAFRRLGFIPDDIYAVIRRDQFGILLKSQGREFFVQVDSGPHDTEVLAAEWGAGVRWWNDPGTAEADRQELWDSSTMISADKSADFVLGLLMKGFVLPRSVRPS